jgi:mono/diheme cytochrome c family protein
MKKFSVLLLIAAVVIIAGSSFDYSTVAFADNNETIMLPQDPADAKFPEGAKIYKEKCVVCHQVTGEGVPGAFPPLKNSDYLLADKKRAVAQVLNGSNEAMVVNGMTYTVPMPPQVESLEEAVQVINYVLNAWGNEGGTISLDEVSDIKKVR